MELTPLLLLWRVSCLIYRTTYRMSSPRLTVRHRQLGILIFQVSSKDYFLLKSPTVKVTKMVILITDVLHATFHFCIKFSGGMCVEHTSVNQTQHN